jgi:hypothetical protein
MLCKWPSTALLCVCCRELYTEKEVIGEERRARWENSPMGRFTYDYLLQALDNPYRRPVIGEAACLVSRTIGAACISICFCVGIFKQCAGGCRQHRQRPHESYRHSMQGASGRDACHVLEAVAGR